MTEKSIFSDLRSYVTKHKKITKEMTSLLAELEEIRNLEEKKMIISQLVNLKNSLKKINTFIPKTLDKIKLIKPLHPKRSFKEVNLPDLPPKTKSVAETKSIIEPITKKQFKIKKPKLGKKLLFSELEKETVKRIRKKKKKAIKKKAKGPSKYVGISNKIFSKLAFSLKSSAIFKPLKRDLIKAKMQFIPESYISVILFTTLISILLGIFVFTFFLFFNVGPSLPIITGVEENIGDRFLKVFWILFAVPIGTFLLMYFYPSMEKKAAESKINQELPFATIHMAAVSGSMLDPSKIFSILISTKEYPHLAKEFTKLMNEINVYGYDLVSALRNSAFNSPSKKLSELFNGLATTINSGGDLPNFFEKRSQSLLFDHRLEKEKEAKASETFMDIYISVVIAAPMILMLLLMMMKISDLGVSLSTGMITLGMVLGVTVINIGFLTFLYLKQPKE